MAGTRRSTRQAGKSSSSPSASQGKLAPGTGSKRKADSKAAPKAKRGKKGDEKEQTTIEASMSNEQKDGGSGDVEMKDDEPSKYEETSNGVDEVAKREEDIRDQEEMGKGQQIDGTTNDENKEKEPKKNGFDALMNHDTENGEKNVTEEGTGSTVPAADNAVEHSSKREEAMPSNILEKGIIYFFFRGRVGVNEPSDVNEIARSYIVLRPMPLGAKLGEGPIGDERNVRMLSLPKKVLPVSPKDRFMTFVEKTNASLEDVKQQLSSSDYSTKTVGVRHTPAATPIGEGVYALTRIGRETHLAYILTIPSEIGEVQDGVGLRQRGSYLTSAKNPTTAAPANASLPQGAEYPKEILDEFGGRGWMPLEPKLLNYENTQFLMIGHKDNALEKATKPQDGEEQKSEKETPLEEISKLEDEDEIRVEHLKGDDAVFTDLGLSVKEYPKVPTTWS